MEQYDEESYITNNNKGEQELEEFQINDNPYNKSPIELMKSFREGKMGKDELYQIFISNTIALNLYQSLYKLKRGQNDLDLFKCPCQIKIYPKTKLMVIYLVVSYNFLRIKTELQSIRENKKLKFNQNFETEKEKMTEINESPISKINNDEQKNDNEKDNEDEKEIIFTIGLLDFFKMLDLLLTENKENSLVLGLDQNFTVMTAQFINPDVFNQIIYSTRIKFNLLKNDTFSYAISNPDKNTSKKRKKTDENKENEENSSENNDTSNDNDNNKGKKNHKSNKNYENNHNYEELESIYLEKKFLMEPYSAKYLIEGQFLLDLYFFMKGINLLYENFSTHNIGISMTSDRALFYCPNLEKIRTGKYIEEFSKNLNQQLKINIKSIVNSSFTALPNGFNSFYRTKFLSKFITSFYNKNDKRLLVKVNPNGKMILSYTFSDPKSYSKNVENDNEKNKSYTEELDDDFENNENPDKIQKYTIKNRLLNDESKGNIVEMIFYPVVFDICKS